MFIRRMAARTLAFLLALALGLNAAPAHAWKVIATQVGASRSVAVPAGVRIPILNLGAQAAGNSIASPMAYLGMAAPWGLNLPAGTAGAAAASAASAQAAAPAVPSEVPYRDVLAAPEGSAPIALESSTGEKGILAEAKTSLGARREELRQPARGAPSMSRAWLNAVYDGQGYRKGDAVSASASIAAPVGLSAIRSAARLDTSASDGSSAPSEVPSRIPALDAVRGLAILSMIPRNLAGILFTGAHPWWFVAMGAVVPALFMFINGFVIAHSAKKKNPFSYYLLRGVRVALVASLVVDAAIWNITPFITVDVLYTIAALIPLVYLVQKLNVGRQLAAAALVFAAAFPLQWLLGYAAYPSELELGLKGLIPLAWAGAFIIGNEILKRFVIAKNKAVPVGRRIAAGFAAAFLFIAPFLHIFSLPMHPTETAAAASASAPVWHHYLVDGWFPLFPWLGFGFLGSALASKFREFFKNSGTAAALERAARFFRGVLIAGLITLAAGVLSWLVFSPGVSARGGYTIPIFPPTWQYLIAAVGGILTIVGGFYTLRENPYVQKPFSWLQTMGRRSLEIYVLHLAVGQLLFHTLFGWTALGGWGFFGAALLAILICYGVAALLERMKASPWL